MGPRMWSASKVDRRIRYADVRRAVFPEILAARENTMSPRKLAIRVLAMVCLAGMTAWLLWRSGVFDFTDARTNRIRDELIITEVPRPNSGTYTTEEATALLPRTIAKSRAIDPRSPLVSGWKNPTNGFRVHVTAKDDIETINFLGETQTGIDGLKSALALSESMQYGNPLSVLLTSETDGWHPAQEQQILAMLFRPSIQLYIVTDK